MKESWKPIPGYTEYHASDLGRICDTEGRICPQSERRKGYLAVSVRGTTGRNKTVSVHRLVATAFCGLPPAQALQVNHLNGNKQDNRARNLQWVTQQENIRHARDVLRVHFGPKKITADIVLAIRSFHKVLSSTFVGKLYRISPSHVRYIWRGDVWKTPPPALANNGGSRSGSMPCGTASVEV